MNRTLDEHDLKNLAQIAMDEIAIRKGHRNATVVSDPKILRVVCVGHRRGREDIRKFYYQLGPDRCEKIQSAAMDMNPGYVEETKAKCPRAQIVFDLFHIVAK